MKKLLLAALAALTLTAAPAMADNNIGVVNVQKVMQESKAGTSIRNQLQAKEKSFQADLDAKQKDLKGDQDALIKEKDKIDKDAFNKKAKAFEDKFADAQKQVQQKKVAVDKATGAALEEIQKNLADITKQLAAEKKLNLILSSNQVIYGDQSLDLTDEVLKRLDAKLPNVTLKF